MATVIDQADPLIQPTEDQIAAELVWIWDRDGMEVRTEERERGLAAGQAERRNARAIARAPLFHAVGLDVGAAHTGAAVYAERVEGHAAFFRHQAESNAMLWNRAAVYRAMLEAIVGSDWIDARDAARSRWTPNTGAYLADFYGGLLRQVERALDEESPT